MKFKAVLLGDHWIESDSPDQFVEDYLSPDDDGTIFVDENGNEYESIHVLTGAAQLKLK